MSSVNLGKNSTLSLDGNEVTGVGRGVDQITRGRVIDTRAIPGGRGSTAVQLGNFVTHDFGVSLDSNEDNDPALRSAWGSRLDVVYRERGAGAGRPQAAMPAVAAATTLTFSVADDSVRWSVQMNVDGTPVETEQ